jgi:hypothetical protein
VDCTSKRLIHVSHQSPETNHQMLMPSFWEALERKLFGVRPELRALTNVKSVTESDKTRKNSQIFCETLLSQHHTFLCPSIWE